MRNVKTALCILITIFSFSCSHDNTKEHASGQTQTAASVSGLPNQEMLNADPETTLKDFKTWWNYNYFNIKLSENYTAFDDSSRPISKETFLTLFSSGKYVAFRYKAIKPILKYQLYKLRPGVEKFIKAEAKQFGSDGYRNYKMEGTEIPGFNFTDLNGETYNKATTKGKVVVLKCWFINCTVCVQEMPFLNTIVEQYKNRNDIVFISLAFDTREKLQDFMSKRKFDYAVVPVQQKYMEEDLKVTAYPTQFIINKSGVISKVISDSKDLVSVLKNEL